MWLFLSTEIMFFGGMFLAYTIYRTQDEAAFAAASHELDLLLGTVNTAVLLCSSLTMALAVSAAETVQRRKLMVLLAATMILGCVFLGIKGVEYYHKYEHGLMPLVGLPFDWQGPSPGHAEMFFNLYFLMTGVHALHMLIGLGVLLILFIKASPRRTAGRFCGAGPPDGTLLALRRHCLGVPVSVALLNRSSLTMTQSRQGVAVFFIAFVALMLLLALTVEAARHDLGRWNFAVATLIAAIKAVVIVFCFMQIRRSDQITKLVVCAGFFWLAILFTLSLADYWTRDWLRIFIG